MRKQYWTRYLFILLLAFISAWVVLPQTATLPLEQLSNGRLSNYEWNSPLIPLPNGQRLQLAHPLKRGLDISGGMQITLGMDMTGIPSIDQPTAAESAKEVILRRVDMYGIAEPVVQTVKSGSDYRLLVELPGVTSPSEAASLVGQTAQLEFALLDNSPGASLSGYLVPTGLTGAQLKRAVVQFNPQTNVPEVGIEFDTTGSDLFADITEKNVGKQLAILLDGSPVMAPMINEPIYGGTAAISGGFTAEQAKQLAVQLSAGALPVPISVLEQQTIGASLGEQAVRQSIFAGIVGILLVIFCMISVYRWSGVIAGFALLLFALYTIATYKILGVVLTLPGIAGLILTIGMAVDANILIFERMKEELRLGKPFGVAMELGFGKAWDSIKDANVVTILTAVVLINPFNLSFLNTSGLVRGFGLTLLIGVLLGLFTGVVVTRTLMRLFLQPPVLNEKASGKV